MSDCKSPYPEDNDLLDTDSHVGSRSKLEAGYLWQVGW
jgi:hypothetical protein